MRKNLSNSFIYLSIFLLFMTFVIGRESVQAAVSADKTPLAYFGLNEGSGTTTTSGGQHAIEASLSGGAAWEAVNLPFTQDNTGAMRFSGEDGAVKVLGSADNAKLKVDEALTVAAWVYPTDNGGNETGEAIIISKEGEYELARFDDGTLRWAIDNTNPNWQWIDTGAQLPLNEWSHVAFMYADALDTAATYLNGIEVDRRTASGPISDHVPSQNEFWIGGRQALPRHFEGIIDEVYVYDQPLLADEIAALAAVEVAACNVVAQTRSVAGQSVGMVGYQQPDQPIPHHEPGYQANEPTSQMVPIRSTDASGRSVEVEGTLYNDPLEGNPTLVKLDNIAVARADAGTLKTDVNIVSGQSDSGDVTNDYEIISPVQKSGSEDPVGRVEDTSKFDLTAGDVNGDNQDEQVLAHRPEGIASGPIHLKITGFPGTGGNLASEPVAINFDGSVYLFARGYDDALWVAIDKGPIVSWQRCDGTLASGPAVVAIDDNTLNIVSVGTDGQLWERTYSVNGVQDWTQIVAGPVEFESTPAVVVNADGSRDVFARGTDNAVYTNHFNGESWGAWASLGGFVSDGLGAIGFGIGQNMTLLARGFDDALWYRTFDGSWGDWQTVKGASFKLASAVTPLSTGANSFDVYGRTADSGLQKLSFNNGQAAGAGWQAVGAGASLGSRPGVVEVGGQPAIYSTTSDGGRLIRTIANEDWLTLNTLAPGAVEFNTGLIPQTGASIIKVITGHFSGNGREQIMLAFVNQNDQFELRLYEADGGFAPRQISALVLTEYTIPSDHVFDIDSGDFIEKDDADKNGTVELAIFTSVDATSAIPTLYANRYIIDFDIDNLELIPEVSDPKSGWKATYKLIEASITRINFFGEGTDDLAIAFAHRNVTSNSDGFANLELNSIDESSPQTFELNWLVEEPKNLYGTNVEIDAGDLTGLENGLKKDELVVAVSNDTGRNFKVDAYSLRDHPTNIGTYQFIQLGYVNPTIWWGGGYKPFDLAVGDFDRDLTDEMAVLRWNDGQGAPELLTFELVGPGQATEDGYRVANISRRTYGKSTLSNEHVVLAAGDFTGQSWRVGTSDYRVQQNIGSVVAIINAPPSHTDMVNGVPIEIARGGNGSAEASYSTTDSTTTQLKVESKRSMGFDTQTSATVGNPEGTHVTTSLDTSYGSDFSSGRESLSEQTINTTITAVTEDRVIYKGASYQVWEYPLYADNSGIPVNFITLVFPVPTSSSDQLNNRAGRSCNPWYLPSHQIGNVWSYPQLSDASTFRGYQEINKMTNVLPVFDVADGATSWLMTFEDIEEGFASSDVRFGVTAGLEAQIGGDEIDVGFDTPFGSIGGSITTPSLKGAMQGHYSSSTLSTSRLTTGAKLEIASEYQGIESLTDNFLVHSFLYRADGGYMVLDHTADIDDDLGVWGNYDKPDPTFRRPWAFDALCGADKIDHSPEITFDPEYASPGDMVTIEATVHNYSNRPANNIKIDFYAGDPENGGVLIGTDSIGQLSRQEGPQTATLEWTAEGAGDVRIYAVIDPDNTIAEVHDEVSNTNNNKGYNTIRLAATDFVDTALPQTYYSLEFGTTLAATRVMAADDLTYSVHIALEGLEETLQFELTAVEQESAPPAGLRIIGEPIEFRAYSAGKFISVDLMPDEGDAPSVLKIGYGASEIDEEVVVRRWKAGQGWLEAGCADRAVEQMVSDNLFVVPVCETGRYALFATDASGPAVATITNSSISEDGKSATVQIQLSKPAAGNESVGYTTSNGSAETGSDYGSATGTVSFAAGETSKTITISILDDATAEGSETFSVMLQNPLNLILGSNSTATVTILDDDGTVQKAHKIFLPLINR